jgi:hypothetical protein
MSELRVPLDYELLTEICHLKSLLAARSPSVPPRQIEQAAEFIFSKLFRKLGYLARSTNQAGRLTAAGAVQFRESLEPLYGDDCDPVKLLVEANLLRVDGDTWVCDLFARLNEHLAGDYRPKHMKGNDQRQVGIDIKAVSVGAPKQAEMLTPEVGGKFAPQELDRLMMVIGTLDRNLAFSRNRTQFTEPLLAAAARACVKMNYTDRTIPKEFREFLGWFKNHKSSPRVPKTTEEVLQDFETIYALAQNGNA